LQALGRGGFDIAIGQVLASVGDGWRGGVHFETAETTTDRLRGAGFTDVECWLTEEPTRFERGPELETYLRTVVLGSHLDEMPASEHVAFIRAVADGLGEPVIDYVRLNISARRADA
jgi:trans-aconitate 2-methyltransferase